MRIILGWIKEDKILRNLILKKVVLTLIDQTLWPLELDPLSLLSVKHIEKCNFGHSLTITFKYNAINT